jgi:hypothetical protein
MLRLLVVAAALASGCVHASDTVIRHPLLAGGVDPNRIIKTHDFIEGARRLPPGSVADEAVLLSLDAQQACFAVVLHELQPIDLRDVDATLSAPKSGAESSALKVWPEPSQVRTYDGLVPEQRQVGENTTCVTRDAYGNCLTWHTEPVYQTVMVPGPVNVYEARGRVCIANHATIMPASDQMSLDVRVRKAGFGSKRTVFRWGLAGAPKS